MARPLFAEADTPLLKSFLISRLQTASEADPDVLSDYILALLRHDQSPEEVMQTCITQLADFITSGTTLSAAESDIARSVCICHRLVCCSDCIPPIP